MPSLPTMLPLSSPSRIASARAFPNSAVSLLLTTAVSTHLWHGRRRNAPVQKSSWTRPYTASKRWRTPIHPSPFHWRHCD
ncbi:Hypothetical protein CpP54B96_0474 [Corynebacterium pseudotuberculosis P54B96]|nr:Hypothetical protein CpP54B96_0474 [Corynebacterium pseudotuberculosis P54B96]AKC73225.1 Hypothetical protein Cp226_0487 [Corynebacterium pseudotuberculosis]